jgi:hypothetical protein
MGEWMGEGPGGAARLFNAIRDIFICKLHVQTLSMIANNKVSLLHKQFVLTSWLTLALFEGTTRRLGPCEVVIRRSPLIRFAIVKIPYISYIKQLHRYEADFKVYDGPFKYLLLVYMFKFPQVL